jgi:hypothetical protein
MRWCWSLWAAFAVMTLCGCAGTGIPTATSGPNTSSLERAKPGGCINKELDGCISNLQAGFRILRKDDIAAQIKRNEEADVNGNRVRKQRRLSIAGNLDGWPALTDLQSVELEYTPQRVVEYAEISLLGDPSMANTTDEYTKTGIYEGMLLLLGSDCQTIERADVYKFFQNSVKPKIVRERKKTELHDTSAETQYFQKAIDIPFCGRKFGYTNIFGHDTNYITIENPHGVYHRAAVSFKL